MAYHSLNEAIKDIYGSMVSVNSEIAIGGGDINRTGCLTLSNGEKVFVKSNTHKDALFYEDEISGLKVIASTGTIRVPNTIAVGEDESRGAFLIMEYIASRQRAADFWERFASELADMHRVNTGDFVKNGKYGFYKDNYIGSREQVNTPYDSWIDFFRDCRLEDRFLRAEDFFDASYRRKVTYLLDHIDKWLMEPSQPSLLHGDLWGGNFIVGNDGKAWLIDPAVYVGHAEADIAMTELFGGFDRAFYEAYLRTGLIRDGYEDRREIYNLYHLLNHLISFGRSYYGSVCRTLDYFVG